MTYGYALVVDLMTVVTCGLVLIMAGKIKHSHPATSYFFFHIFVFTSRLWNLSRGAPTLFTSWVVGEPVRESEIVRAMFWGDSALISMTVLWVFIGLQHRDLHQSVVALRGFRIRKDIVWSVTAVAFPIGIVALALFAALPGASGPRVSEATMGDWGNSSWLLVAQTWPGLCLIALIYCYGFRWWLVVPMGMYLGLMSIQGYARFRVIIPAILLLQAWLDMKGRRWPGPLLTLVLLIAAVSFFPLKIIGHLVQEGASEAEITQRLEEEYRHAAAEDADDHMFLDEFAAGLTQVDRAGQLALGQPYYAMMVIAVPRQWWPEKPSTADFMTALETPDRLMKTSGMVLTYLGEGYANWGTAGLVVIPIILAFFLGVAHSRSENVARLSIERLAYLMIASNLLQVYRDGLVSLVIFTVINMMPVTAILLIHLALSSTREWSGGQRLISTSQPDHDGRTAST